MTSLNPVLRLSEQQKLYRRVLITGFIPSACLLLFLLLLFLLRLVNYIPHPEGSADFMLGALCGQQCRAF